MSINIQTIVVGPYEVNAGLVWREGCREAVLIDPGADTRVLLDQCEQYDVTPTACLLTHGHADHAGALHAVCAATGAAAWVHPAEAAWMFSAMNQIPPYYPAPRCPDVCRNYPADGQDFDLAGVTWRVIETPGHTPGGVCLAIPAAGVFFSGDTLFRESVGRTDLPGGDARALTRSLRKLAALPDDWRAIPGHGPQTTVGAEKTDNYFMQQAALRKDSK